MAKKRNSISGNQHQRINGVRGSAISGSLIA